MNSKERLRQLRRLRRKLQSTQTTVALLHNDIEKLKVIIALTGHGEKLGNVEQQNTARLIQMYHQYTNPTVGTVTSGHVASGFAQVRSNATTAMANNQTSMLGAFATSALNTSNLYATGFIKGTKIK